MKEHMDMLSIRFLGKFDIDAKFFLFESKSIKPNQAKIKVKIFIIMCRRMFKYGYVQHTRKNELNKRAFPGSVPWI